MNPPNFPKPTPLIHASTRLLAVLLTLLGAAALSLHAQQSTDQPAPTVDLPQITKLKKNYLAALGKLRSEVSLLKTFPIRQEIARIEEGYDEPKPTATGKLAELRKKYETAYAEIKAASLAPKRALPDRPDPPTRITTGSNDKWPTSTAVENEFEVVVVTEDPDNRQFVYQTPHFQFECDAKLRTTVVREFGRIFEATLHALNQLPLGLELAPPAEDHFKTRLFVERDSYFEAGGPPGSAGVFISRGGTGVVLIPLASLGVKKVGKGFSLTSDDAQHTLVHEITHQCMWEWNRRMKTWYVEGIAEYMAAAPYANGRFKFTRPGRAMRDYLKSYKGVWYEAYTMFGTGTMLAMNSAQWGAGGIRSYASASIMAQYFHHADGEGDGAHIRAYLAALKAGTPEPQARATHLLRGRTLEELEKQITRAWRREDLKLEFAANTTSAN
ncbi:MAG: hypothetical protein P8J87_17450 [Verrucomicrobiales bacterium]|nr:hypothetical protein [Verrucomicrobiales bacterium]